MALAQTTTVTGLQTFIFNCPDSATYGVNCTLQLPNVVPTATQGAGGGAGTGTGGGPQLASQVVTAIKHNSSTIYTSAAGDRGATTSVTATAGDTISVILSSSELQDEQPQAVQCTVAISEGVF